MRTRRLAILLSVTICMLSFSAPTFADVAFSTDSGEVGILAPLPTGGYRVVERTKAFSSNAMIFGYNDGKRLLVAESRAGSDDRVRIFDTSALAVPLTDSSWENARGIRDAVYLRGYLYVVCHDSSNVVKIDTNDHTRKEIEWIYPHRGVVPALPSGYSARGTAIARFGNEIYALFRIEDGNGNHAPSVLVKLADDITTLRTLSYVELPANATDLEVLGGQIYAASQGEGEAAGSAIHRIDPGTMRATELLQGDEIGEKGDRIAGLSFDGRKHALVTTLKREDAGFVTKFWLLKELDAVSAICLRTSDAPQTSVCYDARTKRFWVSDFGEDGGGAVHAYDTAGEGTALSAGTLGGTPRYLATVQNTSGGDENAPDGEEKPVDPETNSGSGGGCTAGAAGALLAVPLMAAALRRKER